MNWPPARLIPAHAGKTRRWSMPWWRLRAHPRSRGENPSGSPVPNLATGSSPLTRGKRPPRRWFERGGRLIPAHAGKTRQAGRAFPNNAAHPRSRGENPLTGRCPASGVGSSPLTRGKRRDRHGGPGSRWLIPAHAGKTERVIAPLFGCKAHPRSRGENTMGTMCSAAPTGSSPLTRGKHFPALLVGVIRGLIPAHAGKTVRRRAS